MNNVKVTVQKKRRRCDVCGRAGLVFRWTDEDSSTWRCIRHSVRLMVKGT